MKKKFFLLLVALCSATPAVVCAQNADSDTAQSHRIENNMINGYNKAMGPQSWIFNGPTFIPYPFSSKTNANFKDTVRYSPANVTYDGVTYTDVPLVYNLHKQLLVTHLGTSASPYSLLNERVSGFDLLGHHFVKLTADSISKNMDPGFYDELYRSKLRVLAERNKELHEETSTGTLIRIFVDKRNYYLKKDGVYYNVNGQGRFFDVLKDKKKELKQYLKDKKIKYNDDPELAMAMLADYYDHLLN